MMEDDVEVDMPEKERGFHPNVYQVMTMLYIIDEFHSSSIYKLKNG
jgi:hypothetical protein